MTLIKIDIPPIYKKEILEILYKSEVFQ